MVGNAIASRLAALGHEVMMGARAANNVKAEAWARSAGSVAKAGTFAQAAAFGLAVFNCTHGGASINALQLAGADNLDNKILIDVANVLPPNEIGPLSLGEQIQHAFPKARVVKTLNTINCEIMVDPAKVPGPHTLFLSGNDAAAKQSVREIVQSFGWQDVIDLGDITTARATEGYLPLWLSLWKTLGTSAFNLRIAR
jgi:predicted dinucleotide-binding enzyme